MKFSGFQKETCDCHPYRCADGFILPSMIIFRGKTNLTTKGIVAPEGFVIVTQEKAWMDV